MRPYGTCSGKINVIKYIVMQMVFDIVVGTSKMGMETMVNALSLK